MHHSIVDEALAMAERTMSKVVMVVQDEAISLGSVACLLEDKAVVINVSVASQGGVESLCIGFLFEVVDEELEVGKVGGPR